MMKRLVFMVLAVLAVLITFNIADADMFTEFVWYREEPEFERIVISRERVRGNGAVDYADENNEVLEKKGWYQTYYFDGSGPKEIVRETTMCGYEVKTVISINPPSGKAFPVVLLKVYVNGILRLDSHMGHRFVDDWVVNRVDVHLGDESISVSYEGYDEGETYLFWDNSDKRLVDSAYGTDKALMVEKVGQE